MPLSPVAGVTGLPSLWMITKQVRMRDLTPVFIFSLPRAGSTLLQRMVAAHPDVATSSEPWLLLPLMDMLQHREQTFTTYGHGMAVTAIREFVNEMDGDVTAFHEEMREFIYRLYRHAAKNGEHYFLDKTPRYHSICKQIIQLFPDAKFIFLFRHPLAVVASMLETFADGKWYLYGNRVDLYDGLAALTEGYSEYRDWVLKVNYENLLLDPASEMKRIFAYLGMTTESEAWRHFHEVEIRGHMKDPTGIGQYKDISTEPLNKWTTTFGNVYRIRWARRYIEWIGSERLHIMGYDADLLTAELDAVPTLYTGIAGDIARSLYGEWRTRQQRDVAEAMARLPVHRRYIIR